MEDPSSDSCQESAWKSGCLTIYDIAAAFADSSLFIFFAIFEKYRFLTLLKPKR